MMKDAILGFAEQFSFNPVIEQADSLAKKHVFTVSGMGGSHLGADIVKRLSSQLRIHVHSDYGLPDVADELLEQSLIICSSYSGNTEEVVSTYEAAKKKGYALAVICVGGKLLEMAKADGVPYVRLPDTGIQPRSALGFGVNGLLKLMGQEELLEQSRKFAAAFEPKTLEPEGHGLAARMKDMVPVIYASEKNRTIAYNWKIKFNETGKIPSFYNVFSELNHNEMTGFDVKDSNRHLSRHFYFIFLTDTNDHPQIQKRMRVCAKLYADRGLQVETAKLKGENDFEKIFTSLVIADWAAVHTANLYGLESEQVPMVEEFKTLII